MPINVTSSQFVTPGGIDPDENLREGFNRVFQRNLETKRYNLSLEMQNKHLALAQEQKRDETGKAIGKEFDESQFLTATNYDPVIQTTLNDLKQRGYQMAASGMDIPTIMLKLGPDAAKLQQYSTTVKAVRANVQDQLKRMKDNGFKGYKYGDIEDEAMKSAFMDKDPKTGEYSTMKDITKVDPTTNYVHQAIDANPDKMTDASGLDAFAKGTPMQKTLSDIKSYTAGGKLTENKVHLIGQNWLVPDKDAKGVTTGMAPKHDIANDGGQVLTHDFTGTDGKTTNAPIRLLDEGTFDNMMRQDPGVADYIKGQTKQHIADYKDENGNHIDLANPKAKYVARAIAYDELNRRKNSTIENAETQGKPSSTEVRLHYGDTPEMLKMLHDQAFARKQGAVEATPPKAAAGKVNMVQAMGEVFNHNPDFVGGDVQTVNGKELINISGAMPKGILKADAKNAFKGVYYDPKNRSLEVMQKGATELQSIPEGNVGAFLTKIGTANGMQPGAIRTQLATMGYKNGKFTNVSDDPTAMNRVTEAGQVAEKETAAKVEKFVTSEDATEIKGTKVADGGEIADAGVRGDIKKSFGMAPYWVKVKKGASVTMKNFQTADELRAYLSGKKAGTKPAAAAPAQKQATTTFDDIK